MVGAAANAELKAKLLELLESDLEFRYAVAAKIGLLEILERLDRLEKSMEEHSRAIRGLQEQVRNLQQQMVKLQEQMVKLQEQVLEHSKAIRELQRQVAEHTKAIKELQKQVRRFDERLGALGVRWGLYSEEAVRNALRRILQEYLGVARVEKWEMFDREGRVLGYPALVEIDVVVKDDVHYLVEVKSSVDVYDVRVFNDKCRFYEKVTGAKKTRKLMITYYVDPKAREAAKALGIEIVTA